MTHLVPHIQRGMERHSLLPRGERILVAVSGGADSVALLHVLQALAPRNDWTLTVAHLDHGIRGAKARADATFVRALAKQAGLRCVTGHAKVPVRAKQTGLSLEMAAREARYAFLLRTARRLKAPTVATAHTLDDQAETLLLRLARGTSLRGLGGIPWVTERQGVRIVRPFLGTPRADIEVYLRAHSLAWREDASNQDPAMLRNRVRHEVLPLLVSRLNPRVRQALARTADLVREENDWIEATTLEYARTLLPPAGNPLNAPGLRRLHRVLRRRLLLHWLVQSGVPPEDMDLQGIERLDRLLQQTRGSQTLRVGNGWVLRREYDCLYLETPIQPGRPSPRQTRIAIPGATRVPDLGIRIQVRIRPGLVKDRIQRVGQVPARASLCRNRVGRHALYARSWKPGDRMAPLGMAGHRKLQDVFTDAKVPAADRARIPVLECHGEIVWVPGYRVARGWEVVNPRQPALQIAVDRLPA